MRVNLKWLLNDVFGLTAKLLLTCLFSSLSSFINCVGFVCHSLYCVFLPICLSFVNVCNQGHLHV